MIIIFTLPLLIALGVALLVLAPLLAPSVRRSAAAISLLLPVSLCLGMLAGYSRMLPHWWQDFPPVDSTRWLAFFLPLSAGIAIWLSLRQRKGWQAALPQTAIGTAYAWLVLAPLREQGWSMALCLAISVALALTLCLYTAGQQTIGRSAPEAQLSATATERFWAMPLLNLMLLGASGVLFVLGSSAVLTQQAIMLALLQLAALLALWTQRIDQLDQQSQRPALNGLVSFNGFVLAALWLSAGLFSSASPWQAAVMLIGLLPLLTRKTGLRAWMMLMAAALILAAILAGVWLSQPQDLYLGLGSSMALQARFA